MKLSTTPDLPGLEDRFFLWLAIAVSLAFAWILWPFFSAVLWGTILAILFAPLYRRLLKKMARRRSLAAVVTVMIVFLLVIIPLILISALLVQEALSVYERFQSGELNPGQYVLQVLDSLPRWVTDLLERFGLTNFASMQEKLSDNLIKGSQFLATKAFNIGQNTFDFVVNVCIVLYLLFFLLRDGEDLTRRIRTAVPLHASQKHQLFNRFTTVIRATVKGNVVVAIVQGRARRLGILVPGRARAGPLGCRHGFSLPAAGRRQRPRMGARRDLFFNHGGAMARDFFDRIRRFFVIGLVDNVLRQILVGKDTKMPDYVVLIATLGGMAIFGINGFVIGPVIAAMFMAVWDILASTNEIRRQNEPAA
jgi:predicted PurR-regulated permease PerM